LVTRSYIVKKINKELYYYTQTIAEWKTIWKDPKKREQKAMALLKSIPAFTKFLDKNSQLAALLNNNNLTAVNAGSMGLQTNASVAALLLSRFDVTSVQGSQALQQQVNIAQQELEKLKTQVTNGGSVGTADELPDFKPNAMRQKRFIDRLNFGGNYQFGKSNNFFPGVVDIGLQVAYKLNEKSSLGIGSSYKLGVGSNWQNISLSHRGFGLRSFVDMKLKGQFFINGGYEKNNAITNTAINLGDWSNKNIWTNSALIGLSKKFKASKKLNCSVLLLYDFLYKQNVGSNPFKFRIGYGL
jgi:hypothetical protein